MRAMLLFLALFFTAAAYATSSPGTPLFCVSEGVEPDDSPIAGFLYDDGDGSGCSQGIGHGVLCRAQSGPDIVWPEAFSMMPPLDGDAFSFDYMPTPIDGRSIVQQSCAPIPNYIACCRNQTVFMSSITNPYVPTVTTGTHCGYIRVR